LLLWVLLYYTAVVSVTAGTVEASAAMAVANPMLLWLLSLLLLLLLMSSLAAAVVIVAVTAIYRC
jgi:hypothetical protein